jgi:hypothetical protein
MMAMLSVTLASEKSCRCDTGASRPRSSKQVFGVRKRVARADWPRPAGHDCSKDRLLCNDGGMSTADRMNDAVCYKIPHYPPACLGSPLDETRALLK